MDGGWRRPGGPDGHEGRPPQLRGRLALRVGSRRPRVDGIGHRAHAERDPVNGVYTPPEHRGRGYATSCVAALSARLLAEGRRFCFLFTDAANPTSNAIYQRIGYVPVAEVQEYRFEEISPGSAD